MLLELVDMYKKKSHLTDVITWKYNCQLEHFGSPYGSKGILKKKFDTKNQMLLFEWNVLEE